METRQTGASLGIKRVYEPASEADGVRILVDRLWPRGMSKQAAQVDRWMKDVAPSHALRKRFHHDPGQWEAFKAAYFEELDAHPTAVADLRREMAKGHVTLVYSARDEQYNNAVALKSYPELNPGEPRPG